MDVKCKFQYGDSNEKIRVYQTPRFEDPNIPERVYKPDKSSYGLHQAPWIWYETFMQYLLGKWFSSGTIIMTLFKKVVDDDVLLVQVHVDDIIFGSTNKQLCRDFKEVMKKRFEMSMLGEMYFFIELQVVQKPNGVLIHQVKYIQEILKKYKVDDASPKLSPFTTQTCLTPDNKG